MRNLILIAVAGASFAAAQHPLKPHATQAIVWSMTNCQQWGPGTPAFQGCFQVAYLSQRPATVPVAEWMNAYRAAMTPQAEAAPAVTVTGPLPGTGDERLTEIAALKRRLAELDGELGVGSARSDAIGSFGREACRSGSMAACGSATGMMMSNGATYRQASLEKIAILQRLIELQSSR